MDIEFDQNTWRISDFAERVVSRMKIVLDDSKYSPHINTIDRWFVEMETAGIHYVNRVGKKRAYNEEDLEIACFVAEMRDKYKWQLSDIYTLVSEKFDTRDFPQEANREVSKTVINEEAVIQKVLHEVGDQLREMQKQMDIGKMVSEEIHKQMKLMLPEPVNMEQETVTRMKADLMLEEEAIKEWEKKPTEERMKRVGWFRMEEDLLKRDNFIRSYKKKHLEEVVETVYGIEKESAH